MDKLITYSLFVKEEFSSPENESYFFGYYNIVQLNADQTKLLAQRVKFEDRMPNANDIAEIGYFNLVDGTWHALAESSAFNWQQGCHLQWLGPNYSDRVIYNTRENGVFIGKILNIETGEIQSIDSAIYAIDPKGEFSITIDYERAHWTRAYSYSGIEIKNLDCSISERDAIFRVDFETGTKYKIFDLASWLGDRVNQEALGTKFWMEHPMLNKSGNRVFCYFRYGYQGSFKTVGIILNTDNGNDPHIVKLNSRESFSHIGWRSDDEVALYVTPQKALSVALVNPDKSNLLFRLVLAIYRRILKPLMPRKIISQVTTIDTFYRLYQDKTGRYIDIHKKEFAIDGHPSFTKDGKYMLTDTYQDSENYRNLYLLHIESNKLFHLGQFYSFVNNMGWRADLHPRFSLDEQKILIDSNTNGFHQVRVMKINWDLIKQEFE
jgi:hypothetical protein